MNAYSVHLPQINIAYFLRFVVLSLFGLLKIKFLKYV